MKTSPGPNRVNASTFACFFAENRGLGRGGVGFLENPFIHGRIQSFSFCCVTALRTLGHILWVDAIMSWRVRKVATSFAMPVRLHVSSRLQPDAFA